MFKLTFTPDKEQMTYDDCINEIETLINYRNSIDDQIFKLREKCQLISLSNSQYVVGPRSGGNTYGREDRAVTEI